MQFAAGATHVCSCRLFIMDSDRLAAKRIAEGDHSAFERLFNQYHLKILNLCYAILHNRHDAEDLVQDIFVEIYSSIGTYRAESKLSTWIYRIAVNKAINYIRKRKIRKFLSLDFTDALDYQSFEQTDWSLLDKQYGYHLHKAIDDLPAKQKTAFVLFMYDELSQKEIAGIMNCSVSAVEVLVHRARGNITKRMNNIDKEIF